MFWMSLYAFPCRLSVSYEISYKMDFLGLIVSNCEHFHVLIRISESWIKGEVTFNAKTKPLNWEVSELKS